MNLGRISTIQCVNVPPPPEDRCQDEAFRLANPTICPPGPEFIIKPGVALICELASVSFRAFTVEAGAETDVTIDTVFQSSNADVAMIGAASGNATGTGAGAATITATYTIHPPGGGEPTQMTAQAELTVMSGADCCDDLTVAVMVLVDQTRSMTQNFSTSYTSKLAYAKVAATALIESSNASKDLVGLARFTKIQTLVLSTPVSDKDAVAALVPQIAQTQEDTAFYDALTAAVAVLDDAIADRKVLVIISDGEDTTPSYVEFPNPIQVTDNFKAAGGIVICLGVRSHGVGYSLLSALSTGGFFINAFQATEDISLEYAVGLKGYLCAGNCNPPGDVLIPQGANNLADLTNWEVSGGGTVDLLGDGFFDYLPGNGLYLDLVGSGTPANPTVITKNAFAAAAGEEYRVALSLAGNHVFDDPSAMIQIKVRAIDAPLLWQQNILISDYLSGFHDYLFSFVPPIECTVKIEMQQIGSIAFPIPGTDQASGILVNSVILSSITYGTILFSDNFDSDHMVYVPPKCGQGTIPQEIGTDTTKLILSGAGTPAANGEYDEFALSLWNKVGDDGYRIVQDFEAMVFNVVDVFDTILYTCTNSNFPTGPWTVVAGEHNSPVGEYATEFGFAYGYDCYGDGCLDVPPVAQLEDPNPPPFLESGNNPPNPTTSFASAKTACAVCPPGFINMGENIAATTLATGAEYETIIQLGAAASASFYAITFLRGSIPESGSWILTLTLYGSNDGISWTALDVQNGVFGIAGLTLTYQLTPPSAAYAYYRASLGVVRPISEEKVLNLTVAGAPESPLCRNGSGFGRTKTEADQNATRDAQIKAQAALRCIFQYTATATYVATCRFGWDGSSTASAVGLSLNSSSEAQKIAEDAAREAALYNLTCIPNSDWIAGEDGRPIIGEGGDPIPSGA